MMNNENMLISIVIPCYNSEKTIGDVVNEIQSVMSNQPKYEYEIILINDASKDNTIKEIHKLCEEPKIVGLDFSKNFGQHSALMAGLRKAQGDLIVCMDDDGQTPPEALLSLIHGIEDSVDVVYARYKEKKHNAFRNIGSKLNNMMAVKLLSKPKKLYISSYFAMKRFVVDEVIKYTNPFPYVIGLVLRTTDKIINIDVKHKERYEGTSGYTFTKLINLWINGFTSFSIKPLRIAMTTGCIFALIGVLTVIAVIVNKVINPQAVLLGWSSLISIIMISSGIIMVMLGLIGEYVGRIFIGLNEAPQYVIKEEFDKGMGFDEK